MTTFWELLRRESTGVGRTIVVTSTISGFANAAMLAIINLAAGSAAYANLNFRYFLMFVVAMTLYSSGRKSTC